MHPLRPFGGVSESSALSLHAAPSLREGILAVRFRISGELARVRLPEAAAGPGPRQDGLWEHTCLEAFIAPEGGERYWELNASPAGAWNVYRFARYREGRVAESSIEQVRMTCLSPGEWELSLELEGVPELRAAIEGGKELELGLTAVIELVDGRKSYWALAHTGPKPDFHLRESFVLRIGEKK